MTCSTGMLELALFRGTRLALVPECRPRPLPKSGSVAAEGRSWGTLRCALLSCPGSFNRALSCTKPRRRGGRVAGGGRR